MYRLEDSAAVRHIYMSLGFKRLSAHTKITNLEIVTPCSLVYMYQPSQGSCYLHLQARAGYY